MTELESAKRELADHIAKMDRKTARYVTGMDTNPEGSIGGIRSRSKRQKRQIAARFDRQSVEYCAMMDELTRLENRVRWLEQAPERERQRMANTIAALRWWDNLKAGDTFTPGANELTIAKKNRLSLVSASGSRWTITEVLGCARSEIDRARAMMEAQA